MWLLAIPLDVTTSAASAMAVGLGADYAIYMMFRIREELFRGHSTEAALGIAMATAGQAILLVAVAIGLGYSVLCFAGFAIYVNLGMLIGASMASSSLASITVIPAFVTIWLQVRPGALFADGTKLTGPAAAVSPWDADQKVRAK
jgi:predicted RND superfamily exporter protein